MDVRRPYNIMEIAEEKLKEILKEQREEYQRHLDVVVEDFRSQIKLIAETLLGQQEQLLAIREITRQNIEAIAGLQAQVAGLQAQVVAIREMVAKNTEDIEIIKMDISFIKQEFKHKVDRSEFEALEKRVLILEKKR